MLQAAALHDANEALRQVVTRLCSPNSDFEGGPTSSEAPYFPDLTAVSHTSPPHILHLADCPGARWANQGHGCSYSGAAGIQSTPLPITVNSTWGTFQVVIASLLNMLRHVNKERASSTSASWVERIAQSVRQK